MNYYVTCNDNLYFYVTGLTPMTKGAWTSENSAKYCFYSERERQTDRQTQTETERQKDRQTAIESKGYYVFNGTLLAKTHHA